MPNPPEPPDATSTVGFARTKSEEVMSIKSPFDLPELPDGWFVSVDTETD